MEHKKQSRRETNKQKVVNEALKSFILNGIEASKVSDIANAAGLTERSAFRYFNSKEDLVLAAALLFWEQVLTKIGLDSKMLLTPDMNGLDKIRFVIKEYLSLYFTSRKELIFVAEAEIFLHRCHKSKYIYNKPPFKFEDGLGPFAKAINEGIKDGSVINDPNINMKYYNAYDSVLGLLEKMAIDEEKIPDEDAKIRLKSFENLIVEGFKNK